jgi:hypothetical protein
MTPPNLGDEQPHSGGAPCTRRGKLQPMRFLGTVARDETSPIRKSIPHFNGQLRRPTAQLGIRQSRSLGHNPRRHPTPRLSRSASASAWERQRASRLRLTPYIRLW